MSKTATEIKLVDKQYQLQDTCAALDRVARHTKSQTRRNEIWDQYKETQTALFRVQKQLDKIRA